jgi:glycosyltransferase involved in cell wall biosynthesis
MAVPSVSVVIPTYNQPRLLIETLQSVFAQTFTDYEVIVVNDGSTDDTLEQLQPYSKRIKIISQQNAGTGAARNRGIAEARGKYIALLDHDDLWESAKLAAQVEFLERYPECSGVSVPYALSSSPHQCVFDVQAVRNEIGIVERPLKKLAEGHNFIMTSSVLMFARNKAEGIQYGTLHGYIEDIQFNIKLFSRGPFGIAGDAILAVYRIHEGNFSAQSAYFYNGRRLLRKMHEKGEFPETPVVPREDLLDLFAGLGRVTAVKQLVDGHRIKGLLTYLSEFPYQLRMSRARFLLTYPALLIMPQWLLRHYWPQRRT